MLVFYVVFSWRESFFLFLPQLVSDQVSNTDTWDHEALDISKSFSGCVLQESESDQCYGDC